MQKSNTDKFLDTIKALRDPETGCPWNKSQSHGSLKRYLIEEVYECLEVIDAIDELEAGAKTFGVATKSLAEHNAELCEELGDLLLQVVLHARIAEEAGYFNFDDVAKVANEKMILRHPHVFALSKEINSKDSDATKSLPLNAKEVDTHWEAAKKLEKASRKSIFEGIPVDMPALARAWNISKKAVRESFEWDREEQLYAQLASELEEFKTAAHDYEQALQNAQVSSAAQDAALSKSDLSKLKFEAELELGDILFTVVNLARWFEIDPEDALRKTNNKFVKRFNKMQEIAKASERKELKDYSSTELEALWQQAKRELSEIY